MPVFPRLGERSQRGYGIEVLERFVRELAYLEFADSSVSREERYREIQSLAYNDLAADRQTVAARIVSAMHERKNELYVPGFWRLIMLVIRHVPEGVFKRMKL